MILIMISFIAVELFCQDQNFNVRSINGKLVSSNDEPLIGMTISLSEDYAKGVVTDLEGKFILEAPKGQNFRIHELCVRANLWRASVSKY